MFILKKIFTPVYITIFLIMLVAIILCCMKQGYFEDEICTWGIANSHYAPFLNNLFQDNSLFDKILTKSDFISYFVVDHNQQFDYGSVLYNSALDTLPPLHYLIFHTICSLFPGLFNKWLGLGLNIFLHLLCIILIYKILRICKIKNSVIIVCLLLYGLSTLTLSNVIMVRMYMLLTLFTLLLIFIILKKYFSENVIYFILLPLIIFLGLLTHYIYAFIVLPIISIYCIYLIKKKKYKVLFITIILSILAVFLMIAAFPAIINQFFANKVASGNTSLANIRSARYTIDLIVLAIKVFAPYAVPLIGILIICIILFVRRRKASIHANISAFELNIILSSAIAFILTSVLTPGVGVRYFYNIIPLFILSFGFLVNIFYSNTKVNYKYNSVIIFITILLCIGSYKYFKPDYVNETYADRNKILLQYKNTPSIYILETPDGSFTSDAEQLMNFDKVYFTNDPNSNILNTQDIKSSKQIVVYIAKRVNSTDARLNSILDQLLTRFNLTKEQLLYNGACSNAYVLSN